MELFAGLTFVIFYFGALALAVYINYRIMKRAVRLGIKEAYYELDLDKKLSKPNLSE